MRLIYTAGLLTAFDGSLGLHGVAYPFYYDLIPPFRGLRSPARFAALVGMTLAILAGFGARRALRWRPWGVYQHAVFAGLVAFCCQASITAPSRRSQSWMLAVSLESFVMTLSTGRRFAATTRS